jgi:hypothetical protein
MKNINNLLPLLFTLLILSGCYSIETSSHYNKDLTRASSESKPIYLSFKETRDTYFYFLLSRDTNHDDYKLRVRWYSSKKSDVLFNGYDSTLKFLIDNEKILSFNPIKKPKIVAYNINSNGREEEGVFSLTRDEFYAIAYSREVSVELNGKNKIASGYFNRRNSFKAFREFIENSH